MIHIPDQILKKIDKILFDYLWNSKPAKIKRLTIIAPVGEGGIGNGRCLQYPSLFKNQLDQKTVQFGQ